MAIASALHPGERSGNLGRVAIRVSIKIAQCQESLSRKWMKLQDLQARRSSLEPKAGDARFNVCVDVDTLLFVLRFQRQL